MIIKKAKKEDAKKISRLRRKTLREINKRDYPKIFLKSLIDGNSTLNILNKMHDWSIFCAWDRDTLLGTVGLERNKIGGLFVKNSQIGKGVGTRLMDFIEEYARSKNIKEVRVYSTKSAFNFYRKRGYQPSHSGYWIIGKAIVKDINLSLNSQRQTEEKLKSLTIR